MPLSHYGQHSHGLDVTAELLGLTPKELLDRLSRSEAGREIVSRMKGNAERHKMRRSLAAGVETISLRLEEGQERSLAEVLAALQGIFPLDFVADAYLTKPAVLRPHEREPLIPGDAPARRARLVAPVPKDPDKMLEHVAACFGRDWTQEGSIVRLRSSDRLLDLLADPPEALVAYLRARYEKNGRLDFSDVVVAARSASAPQLARLGYVEDLPFGYYVLRGIHRDADLLRLYGALAPRQQEAVFADGA